MLPMHDSRPFHRGPSCYGWGYPADNTPSWGHLPEDWLYVLTVRTGNRFPSPEAALAAAEEAFFLLPAWRQDDLRRKISAGAVRWVPRLDYQPPHYQAGWPAAVEALAAQPAAV